MKKLLIIACLLSISGLSISANLGENYEAGGYKLSGYASFYAKKDSSSYTIAPNVDFYISQGAYIGLGVHSINAKDSDDIKSSYFAMTALYGRAFGYNPDAQKGLAYSYGVFSRVSNSSYNDVYDNVSLAIIPFMQVDYYLTPRVSMYVVTSPVHMNVTLNEDEELFETYFNAKMGLSYTFAKKDVTLGGNK